jgi:hypothetical protein
MAVRARRMAAGGQIPLAAESIKTRLAISSDGAPVAFASARATLLAPDMTANDRSYVVEP